MNPKKLCLELVSCETENAVISVLKREGFWDCAGVWRDYGDNENNFATIGNQQSRPEAAVVEKIINSVDAVLMAECLTKQVNPESKQAPQSIQEALVKYFNIRDGKLSNLPARERGKLAENICLVASGAKSNPCYSIIDKGEGQTPKKMPDTLLSIGKSNKLRIPFVQGKFNMGGTGVLQFCGKYNLQLIVSKRHQEITKHETDVDETKNKWGFTVVRREDPSRGVRSSKYTYLAPNREIICFESDGLALLPGEYPNPYTNKLEWGTYIKLYEYQMEGLKTFIVFDLYNRLSLLMPTIALPVRLYERRKGYSGHTEETTLSGLTVRLDEDRRENLEEGFPTSSPISVQGQKMKASIYAFKFGQSEKYTKEEGIIFIINGQTHAYISKAFFSRRNVGMGYLTDSLLVICDCSEFVGRSREDLFMNSRDRLRSGDLRSDIEGSLEDLLKNHAGLKELRERRRREEIENKLGDSKPLADVIEQILKKSPTLSKLFIEGIRIPNPFKTEKTKSKKEYEGKNFPTYFTLIEKYPMGKPKPCPINAKFRVQYKTDVVNDYFDRDRDPGTFILKANDEEIKDFVLNLWNGTANLTVSLPENTQIDNTIHFESTVNDVNRVEPIREEFYIKVVESIQKHPSKPGHRKPPSDEEEGEETEKESYLALPNVIEIRQDDWGRHSFDAYSSLKVIENGEEGYDFFINMDNIHLKAEQKTNTALDSKLLDARYKYGMVLIGIALLKDREKENNLEAEEEETIFKKIAYATKMISPVLLPMISSLGDLEIEETTKVFEETR